jgi:hypothetical protein
VVTLRLVFSIWSPLPILAPPLVVIAMTIPVAVVDCAAWANRAWVPVIRRIGLGAAAGGAAVGTWLSLIATSGPLSPAIGVTLGMNFALLLHDLYRPTPATVQPTHPRAEPTEHAPARVGPAGAARAAAEGATRWTLTRD